MHLLNSSIRPNDSFLHDVLSDLRKAADIVESLRQQLRAVLGDATNNINAATDEIESLRQRMAELEKERAEDDLIFDEKNTEIGKLERLVVKVRDERESLRAQLAEATEKAAKYDELIGSMLKFQKEHKPVETRSPPPPDDFVGDGHGR